MTDLSPEQRERLAKMAEEQAIAREADALSMERFVEIDELGESSRIEGLRQADLDRDEATRWRTIAKLIREGGEK